jgi:hypothetical protein
MNPTHSDEDLARQAFGRLVADEPATGLDPATAMRQGRRLRRRYQARIAVPGLALGVVAAAVVAVPMLGGDDAGPMGPVPTSPQVSPVAVAVPLSDDGRDRVGSALRTNDPDAYLIAADGSKLREVLAETVGWDGPLRISRSSWGSWDLGPTDGSRETGTVSVGITKQAGMLTVHPCRDDEFVSGASCTETTLEDGSYLTRRGVVDHDGHRSIVVSITRDDGTGVFVEANNAVLPEQPDPGEDVSAYDKNGKYAPVIVGGEPALSLAQAAALVRGLEANENLISSFPTD